MLKKTLIIFLISFNLWSESIDFDLNLKIIDRTLVKTPIAILKTAVSLPVGESVKVNKNLYQLELINSEISLPFMRCSKAFKITGTLTHFENERDSEGRVVGTPELIACVNKKSLFEASIEKNSKHFKIEITPKIIQ
ncbi:MAG: hypothetical protein U0T83_09670 [Bacteriovoracaceae bacterium]